MPVDPCGKPWELPCTPSLTLSQYRSSPGTLELFNLCSTTQYSELVGSPAWCAELSDSSPTFSFAYQASCIQGNENFFQTASGESLFFLYYGGYTNTYSGFFNNQGMAVGQSACAPLGATCYATSYKSAVYTTYIVQGTRSPLNITMSIGSKLVASWFNESSTLLTDTSSICLTLSAYKRGNVYRKLFVNNKVVSLKPGALPPISTASPTIQATFDPTPMPTPMPTNQPIAPTKLSTLSPSMFATPTGVPAKTRTIGTPSPSETNNSPVSSLTWTPTISTAQSRVPTSLSPPTVTTGKLPKSPTTVQFQSSVVPTVAHTSQGIKISFGLDVGGGLLTLLLLIIML